MTAILGVTIAYHRSDGEYMLSVYAPRYYKMCTRAPAHVITTHPHWAICWSGIHCTDPHLIYQSLCITPPPHPPPPSVRPRRDESGPRPQDDTTCPAKFVAMATNDSGSTGLRRRTPGPCPDQWPLASGGRTKGGSPPPSIKIEPTPPPVLLTVNRGWLGTGGGGGGEGGMMLGVLLSIMDRPGDNLLIDTDRCGFPGLVFCFYSHAQTQAGQFAISTNCHHAK